MDEPLVVVLASSDGRRRFVTDDPLVVDLVRNLMRSGLAATSPTTSRALTLYA
jgi:hypothetical protein